MATPSTAFAQTWPHHLPLTGEAVLSPDPSGGPSGTLYIDVFTRVQYRYHFTSAKSQGQFATYYEPRHAVLHFDGHTLRFPAQNACYDPFQEGPQALYQASVGPPSAFIGHRVAFSFSNGEGRHRLSLKVVRQSVIASPCPSAAGAASLAQASASGGSSRAAHAVRAWQRPSILTAGWDCCQGGKTSIYAAIYHATQASWSITGFGAVKMHHGWDHPACYPGFSCGPPEPESPGLSGWIGSSLSSGLLNHMETQNWTATVRVWDHSAFSKYRMRHHCGAAGCSMTLKLLYSRG